MTGQATIKCPNCGTQIDINEALYHQLESKHKQEWLTEKKKQEAEMDAKRKEYKQAFDALKAQEESIKEQKEKFDDEVQKATRLQLQTAKQKLSESIKQELQAEQNTAFKILQDELAEKSIKVQELNSAKAQIEQLKREKDEALSLARAEAQLSLNKELSQEKEKLSKQFQEASELKLKEKDKQLEDQKKLIDEMKRKAQQGSMQLQGEVQELAIEEWLASQFPFDTIDEVKKGVKGGDCVQIVHTREAQNCGKIYYESKRTKDFQPSWIEKLKADMRQKGSDIGVLVTEVLPKDQKRLGLVDGIWVCTFDEFKGLATVLRESIIKFYYVSRTQENRTDKMSLLYNYLTSMEFQMQIEAIVEGFVAMKADLESEKRSMERIWNKREKQIDKVTKNTIAMYSSLEGIAGNAIPHIKALELPYADEDDESQNEPILL